MWRGLQRAEAGVYIKSDDLYLVLGVAYSMIGDREGALRALSKSLTHFGPHPAVLLKRAHAYHALNQRARAAEDVAAAAAWLEGVSCASYQPGSRGELDSLQEVARGVRRKMEELAKEGPAEILSLQQQQLLSQLEKCKP